MVSGDIILGLEQMYEHPLLLKEYQKDGVLQHTIFLFYAIKVTKSGKSNKTALKAVQIQIVILVNK